MTTKIEHSEKEIFEKACAELAINAKFFVYSENLLTIQTEPLSEKSAYLLGRRVGYTKAEKIVDNFLK